MISDDEVDIDEFLATIRGNKPPYKCPFSGCCKIFRSFPSIQKHVTFTHKKDNDIEICEIDIVNENKNAKFLDDSLLKKTSKIITEGVQMSYADSKKFVSLQNEKTSFRCNISLPMIIEIKNCVDNKNDINLRKELGNSTNELTESQNFDNVNPESVKSSDNGNDSNFTPKNKKPMKRKRSLYSRSFKKLRKANDGSQNTDLNASKLSNDESNKISIPVPIFSEDEQFEELSKTTPDQNEGYVHFVEKTSEELNDTVEYDLDEEDLIWLPMCNKYLASFNSSRKSLSNNVRRQSSNSKNKINSSKSIVTKETMEYVIDRFEKECHFESHTEKIDEDAVCDICLDGSCENTNAILFCDVCNLAVHQECYGVPYVPEGQWLCRKCLHSPSQPVDCCLCPNKGGAFKQTNDNRWAHVICALWLPEVRFANITFLEPIEDIEKIESARWKLTCYLCKQKNVGACIQCHKSNCYTAFHVTCAQHAGLYMMIEQKDKTSGASGVRKSTYCDVHSPPDYIARVGRSMYAHSDEEPQTPDRSECRQKHLKDMRKLLNQRQNYTPPDCFPIIAEDKLKSIADSLDLPHKRKFVERIHAYWKLKRELRRGVPLLRRLVASSRSNNLSLIPLDDESSKMRTSLKFWQQLRQDLEKARLLSELSRKREKMKRELFKNFISINDLILRPYKKLLTDLINELQLKDDKKIFAQPVTEKIAPNYTKIIKNPMDFSTIRSKLSDGSYWNIDQVKADYELMMNNCQTYNAKGTLFHNAAVKQTTESKRIFEKYRITFIQSGINKDTGLFDDSIIYEMVSNIHQKNNAISLLETHLTKSLQNLPEVPPIPEEIIKPKIIEKPKNPFLKKNRQLLTQTQRNSDSICTRRSGSQMNTPDLSKQNQIKQEDQEPIIVSSNSSSAANSVIDNNNKKTTSVSNAPSISSVSNRRSRLLPPPPPMLTQTQNSTSDSSTLGGGNPIESTSRTRKLRRMPATSTSCSSAVSVTSSVNNNKDRDKSDIDDDHDRDSRILRKRTNNVCVSSTSNKNIENNSYQTPSQVNCPDSTTGHIGVEKNKRRRFSKRSSRSISYKFDDDDLESSIVEDDDDFTPSEGAPSDFISHNDCDSSIASRRNSTNKKSHKSHSGWCVNRNPRLNDVVWVNIPRNAWTAAKITSMNKMVDISTKPNGDASNSSLINIPESTSSNISYVYSVTVFDKHESQLIVPIESIQPLGFSTQIDLKYLNALGKSNRSIAVHNSYKAAIQFACKKNNQPDPYCNDETELTTSTTTTATSISNNTRSFTQPYQLNLYQ